MKTPDDLTGLFRARGLRITPQRQAIFAVLAGNDGHPTAESVYDVVSATLPSISLRTVYQTLNDLVALGEIRAVELGHGAARFDPNRSDHHHLVCTACGAVHDIALDTSNLLAAIPKDGFLPASADVVVHGTCRACAARPQP